MVVELASTSSTDPLLMYKNDSTVPVLSVLSYHEMSSSSQSLGPCASRAPNAHGGRCHAEFGVRTSMKLEGRLDLYLRSFNLASRRRVLTQPVPIILFLFLVLIIIV